MKHIFSIEFPVVTDARQENVDGEELYHALEECLHLGDLELEEACRFVRTEGEPPLKWWAIIGRFLFDDEDSCQTFGPCTEDEAIAQWDAWMVSEDPDNENERTITHMLYSDSLIY